MNPNNRPTSNQLLIDIIREAQSLDCDVQSETVRYKTGDSQLLVRIADKRLGLDKGIFLLTTGIHANEIAGPLTIHQRFAEILACTRAAGLQLVCYPLICASGWDLGTEQNVDGDSGDEGNNDYIRCRTIDGEWTWRISDEHPCWEWRYSSDPILGIHLPAETRAMHKFLQKENWRKIKVAADLHRDHITPDAPPGAYQYTFGDVSRYNSIFDQIRKLTDMLEDRDFQFNRNNPKDVVRSDQNGCIVFHDGSISDLAYRQEVPDSVAIETTGTTPIEIAIEVNMIWIRGLCELVKHSPTGEGMSQQAPKTPNPFDLPTEQARMVNEGGHEPKPDDLLTPEQLELWRELGMDTVTPSGEQTLEQTRRAQEAAFRAACALEGIPLKPAQTSTTPDAVRTDDYGDVATSINEEKPRPLSWTKPKKWF